jgi:two-component system sensor histidine kinase UhpB
VLRIVQEAITNALKHGPARRIAVRGRAVADGRPEITIDNDGRPFVADSRGRGLDNMRRRAALLGAALAFEALPCGTRVVVVLPTRLPDLES